MIDSSQSSGRAPRWSAQFSSIAALLLLLAACSGPSVRPPAAAGAAAGSFAPPANARVYDIDPAGSLIQIRAYREGALASAGHNHVIAVRDLRGKVFLAPELRGSVVQLEFSVDSLSVDEPALREAFGADFPRDVPESARNGTRDNMRGPGLLDAANFPTVRLQARLDAPGAPLATRISIRGNEVALQIPLQLERSANQIVASGELPLKQTELGLTPFSVMLGALRVRDELQVNYRIVARSN